MGKKQGFNMFGKRRNNRAIVWTSLIGLGASAVAYGMKKNQNMNLSKTVQNAMNSIQSANVGRNIAPVLAEFSKELMPTNNKPK